MAVEVVARFSIYEILQCFQQRIALLDKLARRQASFVECGFCLFSRPHLIPMNPMCRRCRRWVVCFAHFFPLVASVTASSFMTGLHFLSAPSRASRVVGRIGYPSPKVRIRTSVLRGTPLFFANSEMFLIRLTCCMSVFMGWILNTKMRLIAHSRLRHMGIASCAKSHVHLIHRDETR